MIHLIEDDLVQIPPGRFDMGGREEDKFVSSVELPRRTVSIEKGFRISRTPVTVSQWISIMGEPPTRACGSPGSEFPMVCVSFFDICDFCELLGKGFRLPSEAEWEYTCRAGSDSIFSTGSNLGSIDANFLYDELGAEIGPGRPVPVGSYPANRLGIYDMIGNVCEWVADAWHPGFKDAPTDARPWMEGAKPDSRVIRGGGWDHLPRALRSSWRDWAPENARWDNLGFRIATDL